MKKFAATYIFPGNKPPLKNGILTCEDDGTIVSIEEKGEMFREEAGVEFYSGILVPGFINAHCHLELSHLHKQIEKHSGMGGFLGQVNKLRNTLEADREKAMQVAGRKMWAEGIVAVGDVSNATASIQVKQKSRVRYHTFVEVFGFHPSRAERAFGFAQFVQQEFEAAGLCSSIVPHSAYSVSGQLFELIQEEAQRSGGILSVHNQESLAEEQFLKTGDGPIAGHLKNNIGVDISDWRPTGEGSMKFLLDRIPENNRLLLVHNVYTTENDLCLLKNRRSMDNTFIVLCPNSNLFIGNTLPPVPLFRKHGLNICLGTDSLASNHQLSVLHEMKTLQQHFPGIGLAELLLWATINGAKSLDMEQDLGTFEAGKKPGINLLRGIDLKNLRLTGHTTVKRLF